MEDRPEPAEPRTVGELIEALKAYPADALVLMMGYEGGLVGVGVEGITVQRNKRPYTADYDGDWTDVTDEYARRRTHPVRTGPRVPAVRLWRREEGA